MYAKERQAQRVKITWKYTHGIALRHNYQLRRDFTAQLIFGVSLFKNLSQQWQTDMHL
jgi:hypothetical protein